MTERSAPPNGIPGWISGTFRVLATLLTVLIFVQPVLAGLFITGNVAMLSMHSANATLIDLVSLVLVVAGVLVWRPGHGSPRLMILSIVAFVLILAQTGFGYARSLAFHIPLGVLLFTFAVLLLHRAYKPMERVAVPIAVEPAAEPEPAP
jgi:hypothetical protein